MASAGGGRAALVVQAVTPGVAQALVLDPWAAYADEAARRRELAVRAQDTTGVPDELVATLAVAGFLSGIIQPSRDMIVRAACPPGAAVAPGILPVPGPARGTLDVLAQR